MIEFKSFPNGFTYLSIINKSAKAKIALQGAHLFQYHRHGDTPLLYVSNTSHFETGKAIRGGIPVCWPWFGKHKNEKNFPQHGFARTALWQCIDTNEDDDHSTEITLRLENSQKNKSLWPYKSDLQLKFLINDTLSLQLTTTNQDQESFTISSALHSYFSVSDISSVIVKGLDNTPFIDTLTMDHKRQTGEISITQETDRVYQETCHPIELHDAERIVTINNNGSKSVVLWNPWIEKSLTMADLDDNGYKTMLCIETANAFNDERSLVPGETHTLGMIIS